MDSSEEEDIVCHSLGSEYFDQVIGHIEDIVLSENFLKLHEKFLDKYWHIFDYKEENKLEYTEIFNEYTNTFEAFFIGELKKLMDNFDMEKFSQELNMNKSLANALGTTDSEIFELLHSFNNFQIFKDLMLDYRRKKEGYMQHMDLDILITKPLNSFNTVQQNTTNLGAE